MRLAVIADVHGNLAALEAVLQDAERRGAEEIWCAGDLVGYLPFPSEVVAELGRRGLPTVLGNYDDAVALRRIQCGCDFPDQRSFELGQISLTWTVQHLAEEARSFLMQLPREYRREIGGRRVLMVHGSPRRLNEYLWEDFPEEELARMLEEAECDLLLCGHTHLPYHRSLSVGERSWDVVNAGSAGKPKHGCPEATYALLEIPAERTKPLAVEFPLVSYDVEATASAVVAAGLPEEFARMIRTGR
ncbi:MAG: metallophosphoesterase family protein [Bacillota bacterium]|nr:metallophosphoesterase family protein [Bacillota bacterium]